MKKGKTLNLCSIFAAVFLLVMGLGTAPKAQAASVVFDWQNGVLDSVAGTFTFDVLVGDIAGLIDLDGWNIKFDITRFTSPGTTFSFHDINIQTDPNYVFFGINDGYLSTIADLNPGDPHKGYRFSASDIVGMGQPSVVNPEGKILTRLVLDDVKFCDWFTITMDGFNTFFADSTFDIEFMPGTYEVHVVPIPGAALLLGSGLLCLIGIRRKK